MAQKWTVNKRKEPALSYTRPPDGTLQLRIVWKLDLKCPKGHNVQATANFNELGITTKLRCEACDADYPITI